MSNEVSNMHIIVFDSYDKENVRWIAKSDHRQDFIAFTEDYNLMGSKEWTIQNDSKVFSRIKVKKVK